MFLMSQVRPKAESPTLQEASSHGLPQSLSLSFLHSPVVSYSPKPPARMKQRSSEERWPLVVPLDQVKS